MRWLFCGLLLASCARTAPSPPHHTRVVVDGIGRQLEVGQIKRIVSLAPSSTEIAYALGAGPSVVGVDRFSDYPVLAQAVTQVGSNMEPSMERILALRPDVVLVAKSANSQRTLDQLMQVGLPVYVSNAESLAAIFTDIEGIGNVLGREADAKTMVTQLRQRLAAVQARVGGHVTPCAVVVWPAPLVVAAGGNHVNDLLTTAGCKNVVDDSPVPFPTYSDERLVKRAPSVLFVGTHATGAPALAPLERLSSIPAVRDHRVHLIDGDLMFRPGPRVIDGIELLARFLAALPDRGGP